MSTYVPVKCLCGHPHRGRCPIRACGCQSYRRRTAALPARTPRVVRGVAVLKTRGITS